MFSDYTALIVTSFRSTLGDTGEERFSTWHELLR